MVKLAARTRAGIFYCYPYCSGNLALSGSSTRLLRQKALGLQVHGFYSLRVIN
ncbi:hypothetical protein T1E_2220 [Pseudomonas putida DOT-T1E]|uniref:Uncharacterized protein n=1 Tax=Pseudomonas putida (strain DOT-T1E) TaxID=1196325 RepID=I7B9K3_PSEPT|nr:hypothetical protein T1E_2220 [Pseudomonas putida DOT-T1E]